MPIHYQQLQRDSQSAARTGTLTTRHAVIQTPVFMPVGTYGTVKGLTSEALQGLGAQIILANAYHLYLRPGAAFLKEWGGLHRFMNWPGALLTDSGGYQMHSLSQFTKITEEGVHFRSHYDGSSHLLTPELLVEVQAAIGSDIAMPLDCLVPHDAPRQEQAEAVAKTLRWLKRASVAKAHWGVEMFAITQGATDLELRRQCLDGALELDFSGIAIGGLSVGEKKEGMLKTLEGTVAHLENRQMTHLPRYLMGVGMPEDLVEGVWRGIDMFDCVLPTRNARNGMLFSRFGDLNIRNAQYTKDERPIDAECGCFVCKNYSRAYIRYLFKIGAKAEEPLGIILNTHHNVFYYLQLMSEMRAAINAGKLADWRRNFYEKRSQHHEALATEE